MLSTLYVPDAVPHASQPSASFSPCTPLLPPFYTLGNRGPKKSDALLKLREELVISRARI